MRIGIDARPLIAEKITGIGTYLLNVLDYIFEKDQENEYILYTNKPLNKKYMYSSRITEKCIDGKVGTIWLRYVLPSIIKKDNIDVFWGTQHILPKKVKGIKYVLTVHDLALLLNPSWGTIVNSLMQNIFARLSIRSADKIIADSLSTKKDICKICKVRNEKIDVVYLGNIKNDIIWVGNTISDLIQKYDIKGPYYLYLGTIEPRKNIETIITAFEIIAKKEKDTILVLAGGLGWKYKNILRHIKNSPYNNRIIMTGYINEKEKKVLLKNCICFLFPSHYEGFGLPILEAFSNNAMVITSYNSSLAEVGGNAAFYVKNENSVKELSDLMCEVRQLSSDEIIKRIELGNRQVEKFSWQECGEKTWKTILKMKN